MYFSLSLYIYFIFNPKRIKKKLCLLAFFICQFVSVFSIPHHQHSWSRLPSIYVCHCPDHFVDQIFFFFLLFTTFAARNGQTWFILLGFWVVGGEMWKGVPMGDKWKSFHSICVALYATLVLLYHTKHIKPYLWIELWDWKHNIDDCHWDCDWRLLW